MTRNSLLLPGSVLLGSAMIGAGLYFGLRAQSPALGVLHPPPPALSAEHVVPTSPPPANQAVVVPDMPLTLGDPATKARATDDAKAAIVMEKKSNWLQKCWGPAVAAVKEPATSRYTLSLSFDAQGKEVGRGVSELRDMPSRSDVATCLSRLPQSLKIPPPGMPVNIEVSVDFP